MDIGIMQPATDPLVSALMDEKDRLDALMNGYAAVLDRLKKVNDCLGTLARDAHPQEKPARRRYASGDETVRDVVSRILLNAGGVGMTARQVDAELRKTHPDRSLAAVSQALNAQKKAGEVRHIGQLWSLNSAGTAA